jgi:hypothetical protein
VIKLTVDNASEPVYDDLNNFIRCKLSIKEYEVISHAIMKKFTSLTSTVL